MDVVWTVNNAGLGKRDGGACKKSSAQPRNAKTLELSRINVGSGWSSRWP